MKPELRPRLPWSRIIPGLCLDVFYRRKRDFLADCRAMEAKLGPRARVTGMENIPSSGPLVIVANHLQGPGLWIGWPVALATAAVARARGDFTHWLVSVDYDRDSVEGAKKLIPGTRWAFARVAHAWSMIPVDPQKPGGAARGLLQLVREGKVAGVFPEGAVQGLKDGLHDPQPTAMRLLVRAAASGAVLLPVAFAVEGGTLTCAFLRPEASAEAAWRSVTRALAERGMDVALVAGQQSRPR
ncbi:MAG: hypothetical protein WEB00_06190 [Dehalococcoidia bacterium]